ncbi:MAG: permease-like cell division protein FtsX [Flavobacteriaceae bacterium]|nr:permease-like cell division protein FtsX [Flavobacteriaceae bacterium]
MSSFEKYQKRRLRLSSLSVIISITLILFLLGVLGLLVLQSKNISNKFKEKFEINIFLDNKAKKKDIAKLQKLLEQATYTKNIEFISKIDAYNNYLKDVGEDFMEELDENPLKNGFNLYLKAAYFDLDKISEIEDELSKNKFIDDVSYSKATVSNLSDLVQKTSFWLLSFSALLGLIAIVLINSYLRLSVYAKRFNIKTMQMVGATKSFIRKPFLYRSIKLGMLGALLAIAILSFILFYFNQKYASLELLKNKISIALLFLGILILGITISWLSTYFATKRFLKLKTDELYY